MSIKIAIVGTGGVARDCYLPYLAKQKDVTLTYFSRTRAKAEACAAEFGGQVVDTIADIHHNRPDAILVLTRETQRYEVAKEVLKGKPKRVFFEKPLVAQNGQDKVCEDDFHKALEILRLAKNAKTETAMVFNYRFFTQTERMRQIIAERNLGKLTHASMFVSYLCWSHCIDLLHLFGGRAVRMTGLASAVKYKDAVDMACSFLLANGASGTILGTNGIPYELPLYHVTLNFERGAITFNDLDGPVEIYMTESRYRERHTLIGHHSRYNQYNISFEKSLAAYLDSIRRAAPPPVPGIAGVEELQFEVAMRRAVNQGAPVDVQRDFPIDV